MKTQETARQLQFHVYGLVILLMLAAAIAGAVGGYSFRSTASSVSAAGAGTSIQAELAPVTGVSDFAGVDDAWKEHRDMVAMQKSQRLSPNASLGNVDTPAGPTAAERYQILKARQIEGADALR